MNIKRGKKMTVIPMNAMSDVAFLLLIFIMLVSLINYRKEIKVDYPEARDAVQRVSERKNLEIWINKEGSVFLDGESADLELVEDVIADLYRTAPATRVHIIADRNTPFENVNKVLSIMQLLEYRVVSFVVKDD
ncbi:MAG: biopolymer transporter ExbD [Spirochaetaceae bacterium]|jgi:biopolymer transport protein ExbD|nr:biopolymer transporter ExbD [Spirochaetaceae bacterium]